MKHAYWVVTCILLVSCNGPEPSQTVILDRRWNHDFASTWCKMPTHQCPPEKAESEISGFEKNFAKAFAKDSGCERIRLLGVREPAPKDAMFAEYWSLTIDFIPGRTQQHWGMIYGTDWKRSANGEGRPESVARSVCAFIEHTGGSAH